jgi:enoyl-CoA hydratase
VTDANAASSQASVRIEKKGAVTTIVLARPAVKNAVDRATAEALSSAFRAFDADPEANVAVLYGEGGTFCAGADLSGVAKGVEHANRIAPDGDAPLGPSRMLLTKPIIAAVEGHAVAGGLELACLCDLRVADETAVFGVFCRRFGVPLIDGGTVRLPRLLGLSRALDLILTGRPVGAPEALAIGLANRVVPKGTARAAAEELAALIAAFPQQTMRNDRRSAFESQSLPLDEALKNEFQHGLASLGSGEALAGATRFKTGTGRHGSFE